MKRLLLFGLLLALLWPGIVGQGQGGDVGAQSSLCESLRDLKASRAVLAEFCLDPATINVYVSGVFLARKLPLWVGTYHVIVSSPGRVQFIFYPLGSDQAQTVVDERAPLPYKTFMLYAQEFGSFDLLVNAEAESHTYVIAVREMPGKKE